VRSFASPADPAGAPPPLLRRSALEPRPAADPERDEPWRVILHNDPITPMEYVVPVLIDIFGLGAARATWVMLRAHFRGQAFVGSYPPEDARQRVAAAHARARIDGWPLRLTAEPTG
jgi:ATP-dependent Clp protease adaptor protein ClpS